MPCSPGRCARIGEAVQAELGGLSARMTDLLAGFAVVRSFNLGAWILERFEGANERVYTQALRRVRTEATLAGANEFGGLFGFLAMAFGAYQVLIGQTTIGVMLGLLQLSNQIRLLRLQHRRHAQPRAERAGRRGPDAGRARRAARSPSGMRRRSPLRARRKVPTRSLWNTSTSLTRAVPTS